MLDHIWRWRVRLGMLALLAAMLAPGWAPATASAEPLCTDTWTGPSEGEWTTAGDWSTGEVPGSTSVACIASGKTVSISAGGNLVGVIEDEGTLSLTGGSLELASALEASRVASLKLQNATLTGPGTLDVTASLTWDRGATMSGSGKTVVEAGVSASILTEGYATCEGARLVERTFVNDGTVSLANTETTGGSLSLSEGARLENAGVFNDNSSGLYCIPEDGSIAEGSGSKTAPFFLNTGTFEETETSKGPESTNDVDIPFENQGTFNGKAGSLGFGSGVHATLASGSVLKGSVGFVGADVTAASILGAGASVALTSSATLSITSGATATIGTLSFRESTVTGAGTVNVLTSLNWYKHSIMTGTGQTVLEAGGTGGILEKEFAICDGAEITERTFVNDGTVNFSSNESRGSTMLMSKGARIDNNGLFVDNSNGTACEPELQTILQGAGRAARIVSTGKFERTDGLEHEWLTSVDVPFEDWGKTEGKIEFPYPVGGGPHIWGCSEENPSFSKREAASEAGVCTASGDLSETQADFAIGGRGVGLNLTRTYNSQAAQEGVKSTFGYGWSSPYSEHLNFATLEEPEESPTHIVKLTQENGSTVEFIEQAGGEWKTPEGSPDILTGSISAGFMLTLEDRELYKFSGSSGRLESVADRNGNTTTFTYTESGRLEKVTDPDGRTLKFAYNSEGLVESVEDPMKHVVKYTYEGGNLASVTQPGETALRWQFKYEGSHQLNEMIDGRGGKTSYKYDGAHRVKSKTDPMARTTAYEYGGTFTKITNEATKAVTIEYLTSSGQLVEAVHGWGTSYATTEAFKYETDGDTRSSTNGDGKTTQYEYEPTTGNRILMEDPEGHKTKWTYNSHHEIATETTPDGETTTIERNSDGDPETVSRPAPSGTTQTTKYGYDAHGDETSMENPLKQVWKYEYSGAGDRTAEIDPEGDKRTWGYNEDSQETSMVSPRGHVSGAKEAKFTTTTERDTQGRPIKVIAPLKRETTYTYDGDGNVETETDPELNKTTYTYNADNERTKVKEPNGTTTETGYDGAGQATSQTDGNKHTTKYERNALEQVTEIVDFLARKTLKEYDGAGNLVSITDAAKRTTTEKYNPDSRLVKISYSDGKTPTAEYEYNGDGDRTKMVDGSGATTYEYDQLDRLTNTKDGHGDTIGYEYNLANQQTKITYPNGKAITRAYDNAGRLKSVTDWHEPANTTKFAYDADSNLTATTFPSGTGDEDAYTYNEGDVMSEIKMTKGSETLASLVYTRNKDEEVTKATTVGLPGEEKPAFSYDEDSRVTKGAGITYKYDEANNPTTIGSHTYSYNAADELERSTLSKTTVATYGYNEVGERTTTEPASGATTTYGWDQAGSLASVTRPKSGETPAIEDTYVYDGDGLRTSQTVSGTTSYFAWDAAEVIPVLVNDGGNSYMYGPGGLPFEQISNAGVVLYLHHDQQGSTRMLTSSTGVVVGTTTYDAYGNETGGTGTSTTSIGYDGQYVNVDTGLIYLRAREYDPATGQFLSVDPAAEDTHEPYAYSAENPLSGGDPTGLEPWSKKVKAAIAHCESLKSGPTERSKKNPYYHNKVTYQACQTLLRLPSEVYGTGSSTGLSKSQKALSGITQLVTGTVLIAAGVTATVACTAAEVETEAAAHCLGISLTTTGLGLGTYAHGERELVEAGDLPPVE